jgi:ribosomal protein S18 acetylase RimI-like enzyme
MDFSIRRATTNDAAAIVAVLKVIAAERVYTAIDQPWSVDSQRQYLALLSPREAIHVAVDDRGEIIGYQTLDRWAPSIPSMAHVGQLGTFLAPAWRRRGVGHALFRITSDFARKSAFAKFVIQVRASNQSAQEFYKRLGFLECGRLSGQVRINGEEDDEILFELFL